MALRLIQGGRASDGLPGLIVEHAAEIATLAGRHADGRANGRRLDDRGARRRSHATMPRPRSRAGRAGSLPPDRATSCSSALEGSGYPIARFARLDAGGGTVTPGLDRSAHPPAVRAAPARTSWSCASAARTTSRSSRPAAGSSRPSLPPAPPPRTTLAEHGRRWLDRDAGPRHHHDRGEVRLRPRPADGAAAARGRPPARQGGAGRDPADVARRPRGRARVPRPTRRHGGVRPTPHRGAAARVSRRRVGRGSPTCSASAASSARSRRAAILEAAAGSGSRPRLHADELAPSGGAELAAEIGALSADHLAAPSQAGIDALAAAARRGPPGRRRPPAGDDVVPDARRHGAGADVHRTGRAGRPGHRLQPRHVADAEPAAGHDRRLPRAEADPIRGARRGDGQRGGRARARARRSGRSRAGARPTSRSGASRPTGRSRTGRPRTSSAAVVKRGRVVAGAGCRRRASVAALATA